MAMPIEPIRAVAAPRTDGVRSAAPTADGPGFAERVGNAVQRVSDAERTADALAQDIATGGPTPVHELMVAMTKASLELDLMVQVRNRAVEAYQEIMRMPI